MKRITLICFIFFTINHSIIGCSCEPYIDNFCGIVGPGHYIVRLEITDSLDYHLRKGKVLDNLHMEIGEEEITILGGDGQNCGESLYNFLIGDTLILALSTYQEIYYLEGACGLHYLEYSNGKVYDKIYNTVDTMEYETFAGNLWECMSITKIEEIEEAIEIYPNPVSEILNIELNENINDIEIYSLSGKLVLKKNKINSSKDEINISKIDTGIYYVKIRIREKEIIKRIIKY